MYQVLWQLDEGYPFHVAFQNKSKALCLKEKEKLESRPGLLSVINIKDWNEGK